MSIYLWPLISCLGSAAVANYHIVSDLNNKILFLKFLGAGSPKSDAPQHGLLLVRAFFGVVDC